MYGEMSMYVVIYHHLFKNNTTKSIPYTLPHPTSILTHPHDLPSSLILTYLHPHPSSLILTHPQSVTQSLIHSDAHHPTLLYPTFVLGLSLLKRAVLIAGRDRSRATVSGQWEQVDDTHVALLTWCDEWDDVMSEVMWCDEWGDAMSEVMMSERMLYR